MSLSCPIRVMASNASLPSASNCNATVFFVPVPGLSMPIPKKMKKKQHNVFDKIKNSNPVETAPHALRDKRRHHQNPFGYVV